MIYFDKVSKVYPDESVALEDVTFAVEPQEFVSIVGHSGAGKTTLLKLILAEDRPSDGKVFFGSTDIHALRASSIPEFRRKIGVVFQDFRLLPNKNVYENIAFSMEAAGRTDEEIESDVPHVLELVDLGRKIWSFPHELSGFHESFLSTDPSVFYYAVYFPRLPLSAFSALVLFAQLTAF